MGKEKIILTGDRPTGRLHIGHFVGFLFFCVLAAAANVSGWGGAERDSLRNISAVHPVVRCGKAPLPERWPGGRLSLLSERKKIPSDRAAGGD